MRSLAVIFVIGVLAQQTFADEPEAIVGGTPAAPAEFPHQVSLRYYGQHICGGSIVNSRVILTAAHCVHGMSARNFKIATGTNDIQKGELHEVQAVHAHPNYNDRIITNDVAVIILAAPIKFSNVQKPIKLATSPPQPGTHCTLSGWGLTRPNGNPSQILLKMDQATVGQAQCQQDLREVGATITNGNVCALNKRGIGACQGDSGGPFICDGVQHGITSWGIPCGLGKPDVYTSVSKYNQEFIQKYVNKYN